MHNVSTLGVSHRFVEHLITHTSELHSPTSNMIVELPPAMMLSPPLTITLTLLLMVTVYICATRQGRRLPGPIRWPLIGTFDPLRDSSALVWIC